MRVFLIRHTKPLIAPGICYGRLDVDCEDPRPVAERLKPCLPANAPVYSSPSRRARRLAELLSPHPRIDARIAEMNFGEWEGMPWDSIDPALLDDWAANLLHFTPPGGESVARMRERVVEFSSVLPEQPVIVVAHAGVLRALTGLWRNLPADEWTRLPFDFGQLHVVDAPLSALSLS